MSFLSIFLETLPVFLIIGIGCFCRVSGIVRDEAEKSLMRLVVNFLYPCFILANVPGNQSLQQLANVFKALGCGFALTVIGMGVAFGVGTLLRIEAGKSRNTFCLATAIQNYGFIPIALIEGLFPGQAQEILGVLFVHNLGLELAMWTLGIVIVSGSGAGSLRRLVNGPTVAIAIGLTLNFTGWYSYLPLPLEKAIGQLGQCAIPISLLLVGASLAGVLLKERWKSELDVIAGSLAVRFLIMPVFFLGTAWWWLPADPLRLILLIEASMPAAIFPIVIAKHFGGRPAVAVQVTVVTSLFSLVLTPAILSLGMWLVPPALTGVF